MITLIIKPQYSLTLISKMLNDESSFVSSIKCRKNRQLTQSSLKSCIQKVSLFKETPPTGLIILCGEVESKKIKACFSPLVPIKYNQYICDSTFKLTQILEAHQEKETYGFIIIDGSETLFAMLNGNNIKILSSFKVNLPCKHNKGGYSANRYERLRQEKRHNYIRKVCDEAIKVFIHDEIPTVKGIILAGAANFKYEVEKSNFFDHRLKRMVLLTVEVNYGGKYGLHEAIKKSSGVMTNNELESEKKHLNEFYKEIEKNSDLFVFGIKETLRLYEDGLIRKLIVYDKLDIMRNLDDEAEELSLIEYLINTCKDRCDFIVFVSDHTSEGTQFIRSFGGLGGILKHSFGSQLIDIEDNCEISEDGFI